MGSFNYFSYTIPIGSNWYRDTGVRDLEVACFKANSTWINDIGSKDLSNSPIYVVLNTHTLDMILELKYMPIVMNSLEWLEILEMLWSVIRLIFKTSSVSPDFFYVFNLILSFSTCSQSFKKPVRGNVWARTSLSRIGFHIKRFYLNLSLWFLFLLFCHSFLV